MLRHEKPFSRLLLNILRKQLSTTGDRNHLNRLNGTISVSSLYILDCSHHIHSRDDLAEDRMLRWRTGVPPIEGGIVDRVDEELRTSAVGPGIGHAQGAGFVGESRIRQMLIGNLVTRVTPSTLWTVRISAMWTSALKHESRNDAMKMQSIVVAIVNQFKEVPSGDWHGVGEELDGDVTLARLHQYLCHICVPTLLVFECVPYSFTVEYTQRGPYA